ncbi:hypothetical protein [Planobispora longispora]|uniref:WD40 repeat domain-containing protein n=1 Tax=Planobispora longispora TaxID=28887 RepID=A0A8J3RK81_9ACTN|nr:hypothetical protein [Planobispora longispora]BFE85787.1 hypothetical protein GCM10020093_083880 [Planobispora longispora]GIH76180.1 hypothetical protein Plo01_26090 [Planobispora longispora]
MTPSNPPRGLAVLALAAAAAVPALISAPAQAYTGAASATSSSSSSSSSSDSVRYAWIKSCPKKDYTVPCGDWTLTMRSGKTVKLTDARVNPKNAKGAVDKSAAALFAVSGDGRVVNYFKGGKLVVRDVNSGKVRPLPGKAATLPKGLGMSEVDTTLSHDGSIVVVDYSDEAGTLPSLVADLRTGKVVKLPAANSVLSFSSDGAHLLTSRFTDDNTTEFAVFDAQGRKTAGQVVPQLVSNNAPVALSDDGNTVTVIVTGASRKHRLHTYDLAADTVSDAVALGLPKNENGQRLFWDSAGKLTLWTSREGEDGDSASAVKRTVNPETGATRTLDSYKVKGGTWTWWLPGE